LSPLDYGWLGLAGIMGSLYIPIIVFRALYAQIL
jgi:hypothetical protein